EKLRELQSAPPTPTPPTSPGATTSIHHEPDGTALAKTEPGMRSQIEEARYIENNQNRRENSRDNGFTNLT
ncbi:MAG: hypothetical protein AAB853_03295, partial [Patescibacteria group bacterium]